MPLVVPFTVSRYNETLCRNKKSWESNETSFDSVSTFASYSMNTPTRLNLLRLVYYLDEGGIEIVSINFIKNDGRLISYTK